jgi:hypothetical protein
MANGVPQTDVILAASNAVDGQDARAWHVDAGSGSPAVIVADEAKAGQVLDVVRASDGVGVAYLLAEGSLPIITDAPAAPGTPADPAMRDGKVLINATLDFTADSTEAEDAVLGLRAALKTVDPGRDRRRHHLRRRGPGRHVRNPGRHPDHVPGALPARCRPRVRHRPAHLVAKQTGPAGERRGGA